VKQSNEFQLSVPIRTGAKKDSIRGGFSVPDEASTGVVFTLTHTMQHENGSVPYLDEMKSREDAAFC